MGTQSDEPRHPVPLSISDLVGLYRQAFAEHRARALWNVQEFDQPTVEQMLSITRQLRIEGDMDARRLAEKIEQAARAHLQAAVGYSAPDRCQPRPR